ncbi:MAG: hypothetical protein AAGI38_02770 [Bacteroidota bacterium]
MIGLFQSFATSMKKGFISGNHQTPFGYVLGMVLALMVATGAYQAWFADVPVSIFFYSHYQPYDSTPLLKAASDHPDCAAIVEKAHTLYASRAYQEAIVQLDSLLDKRPECQEALLYKGLCFLGLKKLNQSHQVLSTIMLTGTPDQQAVAKWYRTLVLVLQNKHELAHQEAESQMESGLFAENALKLWVDLDAAF